MTTHTFKAGTLIHDLRVELRPVSQLEPYSHNARIHSKKQIHKIAESIKTFGFVNPVLVDKNDNIILLPESKFSDKLKTHHVMKVQDVPYMPGMGWRIMDVIDPENELNHFYESIEQKDFILNVNLRKD